jgi:hypothetical protein
MVKQACAWNILEAREKMGGHWAPAKALTEPYKAWILITPTFPHLELPIQMDSH